MLKIKKIYNYPKVKSWAILSRSGDRAELYYYYKPRMNTIRKYYHMEDYIMLDLCLETLKNKSIYYAKRKMGFAVTEELFEMVIKLLRFQGYIKYANILEQNTTSELMKPIIKKERE